MFSTQNITAYSPVHKPLRIFKDSSNKFGHLLQKCLSVSVLDDLSLWLNCLNIAGLTNTTDAPHHCNKVVNKGCYVNRQSSHSTDVQVMSEHFVPIQSFFSPMCCNLLGPSCVHCQDHTNDIPSKMIRLCVWLMDLWGMYIVWQICTGYITFLSIVKLRFPSSCTTHLAKGRTTSPLPCRPQRWQSSQGHQCK